MLFYILLPKQINIILKIKYKKDGDLFFINLNF